MQDFDSNQNYNSNQLKDNSNFYVENNFSSINSRFFKNDEFNSVQNDFNYNVQMGFTYKISSMIKNCSNSQNSDHLTFLTSRMQEFGTYDDQSFIFNFPPTKNKINWLSPKEFISESFSLFPKDSNGIFLPSEYNNNSFLSAINLLMRNPSLLSRLFETEHVNEAGIYGVWLCDYGIWRLVTVDDKVPTFQSNYLLNEFHCKEKCIFHMILAKALAKFHKGYEKLANMNIISILNYLTGSQSEQKNLCELQAIDDIWVLIKKWREANYLIFFQNNPTEVQLQQIEESPCYSIIDCFELIPTNENENLEQIICLKSPIKGGAILNGKFNKNTNLSYDIKKRLNFNAKHDNDDSIFYLTIEEILKCFTDIGVCKAQSKINDVYHWRTVKNSENFIVKCPLESSGNAIFSLHQKEDSYNSGSNSHYIRVLLAKETGINSKDDNLQFLGGDYSSKNIFIEKNNVESGDYIMVVEVLWADGIDKEITIGCLCENENMNQNFNFEVIQKKNSEILELQKNLIKVYAKSKESKTMRIRDYTASNEPSIKM